MPRILDLVPMPDGRMGVVLDVPPSDDGSVTLWTATERDAAIRSAVLAEREQEAARCENLRALLRQHLCNADGVMSVGECVDTCRCSCTCGLLL